MRSAPPFSPVLLAGMAMPAIARTVVRRAVQSFASGVWSRHRRNFDRVSDYAGARLLVDPVDLPFSFLMVLASEGPQLSMVNQDDKPDDIVATIHGPLRALLDLAAGRVDGDALFFSRDLSIEGDTEVVLALRNAVDDADLDLLEEFAGTFGPLSKPALRAAERSAALFQRLCDDADVLRGAITSPLANRVSVQENALSDLLKRQSDLEKQMKRQTARVKAQEKKQQKKQEAEKTDG